MADTKRSRASNDLTNKGDEETTRARKSSKTVLMSEIAGRQHNEIKGMKLRLLEIEKGVHYDFFSGPKPGVQSKIDSVGQEFDIMKGFTYEDRKATVSKRSGVTALQNAASKHVQDANDWKSWLTSYETAWRSNTTLAKKTRNLALRLALTNPTLFFDNSEWVQGHLVPEEITHAWLAAQQLFGSLWIADYTESVFSYTDSVRTMPLEIIRAVAYSGEINGFVEADFEATSVNNPHVLERIIRERLLEPLTPMEVAKGDWKLQMPVEKWHEVFRRILEDNDSAKMTNFEEIYAFGLKLIQTDPNELTGLWLNGHVVSSPLTYAWKAAIDVLGEAFSDDASRMIEELLEADAEKDRQAQNRADALQDEEDQDKEDLMEVDTEETGKENVKATEHPTESITVERSTSLLKTSNVKSSIKAAVSFSRTVAIQDIPRMSDDATDGDNDATDNRSASDEVSQKVYDHRRKASKRFFLSKEIKQSTQKEVTLLNPAFTRKYSTFMKVKFSPFLYDVSHKDSAEEISDKWQRLMDCLFQIDDKLVVYPWTNGKVEPFHRRSPAVRSKDAMSRYVNRLFVRAGEEAWFRMKIGHSCEKVDLHNEDAKLALQAEGMTCYPDSIQCKKPACAGWFLGSHIHLNCNNLVEALKQNKHLRNIEFEVRYHAIRLSSDRSHKVPKEHLVSACHLHADVDQLAKVKKVLKKIYGPRKKVGCPLGTILHFVPFTADDSIPISAATRKLAKDCFMEQRKFLNNITTISNSDIIGLDYVPSSIGISLREAIMSICHPEDTRKSAFVSVDETWQGTTFVFKKSEKVAEFARNIVPVLSVVMEGKFGAASWNWFDESAKKKTEGFLWDPDKKIVFHVDDKSMADSVYDFVPEDSDNEDDKMDEEEFAEIYGMDLVACAPSPINFMKRMAVVQQINDEEASLGSFRSTEFGTVDLSSESEEEDLEADGHTMSDQDSKMPARITGGGESPVVTPRQISIDGRTPRTADSSLTDNSRGRLSAEELNQLIRDNMEAFKKVMQNSHNNLEEEATADETFGSSEQG